MGAKHHVWTKELDDRLLAEIITGKNNMQLSISMKMSTKTITKRLKEMGFDNLTDARKVMMVTRQHVWTKERDDELLVGVAEGKNYLELSTSMQVCITTINRKLKNMGFEGLVDARNVMIDQ
jgi:DNA-binding MurR/RpiR family transcriptional regulator